jgi:hypothetical protein
MIRNAGVFRSTSSIKTFMLPVSLEDIVKGAVGNKVGWVLHVIKLRGDLVKTNEEPLKQFLVLYTRNSQAQSSLALIVLSRQVLNRIRLPLLQSSDPYL